MTCLCFATQATKVLSNTHNFFKYFSLRTLTHLKLCDSSIANLSSRRCIFTSIESFHFVVQLPDKVDLQCAEAWGDVHRERHCLYSHHHRGGE